MIIGFILLILWVFNYPSGPPQLPRGKVEFCGALVRSTCTDDFTSKWNSKNIAKNLKKWMTSIEAMRTVTTSEMKYYHLSKILKTGKQITEIKKQRITAENEKDIVKYIGNKNCLNAKSSGPVWRIASHAPHMLHQFHDGFLYGIEAENGTFSGISYAYKYTNKSWAIKPMMPSNQ